MLKEEVQIKLLKRPAARLPQKMTAEKFRRFRPEDPFKYEWVDGQILKTTRSMTPEQQFIIRNLQDRFLKTQSFQVGARLVVETDATLRNDEIRRPDVALMKDIQFKETAFGKPFLPIFVIEIASEFDKVNKIMEKLEAYFSSGVQVVWYIYPNFQRVQVYHSPKNLQVLEGEDLVSAAPAVPDFELPAAEIFKI